MEKEKNENFNSLNEDKFFEELELLEEDARKEKISAILKERNDIADKNRNLFARAKKAEGFEQDDDGNWMKVVEKPKSEPKKSDKPDEKLLERLDKMSLQVAGIKEADEIELFNKWKEQTGREADDIVGNEIFKKELETVRVAKANQAATSNIKGEQGASGGAKNTPEYWIAKATKGKDGKLEFPEEMPKELYSKVLNKISEKEPGSSEKLKFYNE